MSTSQDAHHHIRDSGWHDFNLMTDKSAFWVLGRRATVSLTSTSGRGTAFSPTVASAVGSGAIIGDDDDGSEDDDSEDNNEGEDDKVDQGCRSAERFQTVMRNLRHQTSRMEAAEDRVPRTSCAVVDTTIRQLMRGIMAQHATKEARTAIIAALQHVCGELRQLEGMWGLDPTVPAAASGNDSDDEVAIAAATQTPVSPTPPCSSNAAERQHSQVTEPAYKLRCVRSCAVTISFNQ